MESWLDRLMRRENWMAAAVRHGFEAFARESEGGAGSGQTASRRNGETVRTPLDETAPSDAFAETAPSIP